MPYHGINWLAIVVAGLVPMFVGILWYSVIFAKKWMAIIGKTEEEIKKSGPWRAHAMSVVGYLVMAYVMSYFVHYTESHTLWLGMKIGFATWLGFTLPPAATTVLYEFRPSALLTMSMGYHLVCMLLMGALLAVWQ